MKKIKLKAKDKHTMICGILKKVKENLDGYDKVNKFDPNFAIRIYNEKDDTYSIVIRVSRSKHWCQINNPEYNYFIHLCVGSYENIGKPSTSTYKIIRYDENYLDPLYDLLSDMLLYDEGDDICICILANEVTFKSNWFSYTEDDHELDSADAFINVLIKIVDDMICDQCPSVSIFFEYELHDGIKITNNDENAIFMTIQLSDAVPGSYYIGGSMPSAKFDNGRDYSTYVAVYKDLKPVLKQYLKEVFSLRKVLCFDEHMKASVFIRDIEQYKIVI